MTDLRPIKIPLLNPNEPEALLADISAAEGEAVQPGQRIAVIETTKSTGEVLAESAGFLVGLCFQPGQMVRAGDVLAYLADAPDASDAALPPWSVSDETESAPAESPAGLRITNPARELALSAGLNLADLPHGPLVTKKMVSALISPEPTFIKTLSRPIGAEKRVLIYGAGGHGRSLAALVVKADQLELVGFVDDGFGVDETVLGQPVLGGREALSVLLGSGIHLAINGVGGIGHLQSRLDVFRWLADAGFCSPTVIHPSAILEDSAQVSPGAQVFPLAYLGTQVQVGFGCIINTGAIVSHDCILGDFANLSPGAVLAGGVVVAEGALIGMGATVNLGVHVGQSAQIGNGATVKADVPAGGVVPAGAVWPLRR